MSDTKQKLINLVSALETAASRKQTAEEKQVGEYRRNITKILYDIDNVAILNYINAIVEDVAKEDKDIFVSDIMAELKGGVEA